MKVTRFILLTCIFAFSANFIHAQTSAEEYNYLTKGYKIQIESGLDMKAGYTMVDLGTYKTSTRSCNFKGLVKKGSTKLSATLAIFYGQHNYVHYLCIPTEGSSNDLWTAYYSSMGQLDNVDAAREYALFVTQLYAASAKTLK